MKSVVSATQAARKRWEHFYHQADIGIRGIGTSKEEAFEQGATALTAVITDVNSLEPENPVEVFCEAPDDELLFVDWLNSIVYEMAIRKMLFCRFEVHITDGRLRGNLWGQSIDVAKHEPAIEVKGATYTELQVRREHDGTWIAQCIVDV